MIYNINKPVGWTSFDVVKKVRGITREKKVGHGGTLDPFAEGVLIVGTNKDTKRLSEFSGSIKSYRAVLKLGEATDTLDLDGTIIETKAVPTIEKAMVESILNSFIGDYEHVPPMYSAKKVNGVRLYKLARKNQTVVRQPVVVKIYDLSLNLIDGNHIDFSVSCSKGTYVRVLGEDIAQALNTVGHLIELKRTSVGEYDIKESVELKEFETEWMSTAN
ncbi:MAG: tRNA pseudouridine(55) synthase TruB [Candidatus Marinimicrobia bacterium]|jgi:tRNA pseudouridine55 synthase|nr:tRNA pseudouridine(55) synthase TruB [Candidatus Neomarinimicrobiota bacterium]MBT3675827.1 tRNA pseudouridine(55) synthase TruB [Candidatus Neomarinimicrobiota bacterium]MBT3762989.1 tRNA pseudouridine(55) synthase TruB [Candidatus Neomarinimicrobiota bacterium]MBT4069136.1 tRNA pseudouridine(55) synthase TruB [Candidatus Neomarinimicrobiota bacterium]MBT4271522.1 tRNA pseudouridine(55) synthase TruB [Candidatus Neomarinimicrobiota bacterium]